MKTLNKPHFTLIEMMVVMAIIVILFMLILPAFNSVKESAKRSECLSRVRNIAQLGTYYSSNNNGQAPLSAWYIPKGEKTPVPTDFSWRIMAGLIPEAVGERDPHWWMFICTNVLPYWNAGATMNANGYTKGQGNRILDKVWEKIKPGMGYLKYLSKIFRRCSEVKRSRKAASILPMSCRRRGSKYSKYPAS